MRAEATAKAARAWIEEQGRKAGFALVKKPDVDDGVFLSASNYDDRPHPAHTGAELCGARNVRRARLRGADRGDRPRALPFAARRWLRQGESLRLRPDADPEGLSRGRGCALHPAAPDPDAGPGQHRLPAIWRTRRARQRLCARRSEWRSRANSGRRACLPDAGTRNPGEPCRRRACRAGRLPSRLGRRGGRAPLRFRPARRRKGRQASVSGQERARRNCAAECRAQDV